MSELRIDREGTTALVTLSNPGKRNAITNEMWASMPALFDDLAADPGVRVVVVTGDGEDFSAGSDIKGLDQREGDVSADAERAIAAFPKPVLAAIRGYCLGGGCQVALAADLRLAADDARFGIPPANLGIVYPLPGLASLVAAVGPSRAKRLIFTGQRIDATEALRIGLVDELLPSGDVLERTMELAAHVATRSQLSIRAAKTMIRALQGHGDPESVAAEWAGMVQPAGDLAEGQAAFAERREPRFGWNG